MEDIWVLKEGFFDIKHHSPPVDVEVIIQALGGLTKGVMRNKDGVTKLEFTGENKLNFIGCSNAHIIGWKYNIDRNNAT